MKFETMIQLVKNKTHIARRSDWEEGKFIFSQVSTTIPLDEIADEKSLPQIIKDEIDELGCSEIQYLNQLCIFDLGYISYYFPDGNDLFANNWEVKNEKRKYYESY